MTARAARRSAFVAAAVALAATLALPAAASATNAEDAAWAALKRPGTHALMRHATAPGTGDPAGFALGDCATQRNLDAAGRDEARRIGTALADAGLRFDAVFSSAWCRAEETARLLDLGPVRPAPALNSFFADRGAAATHTADTVTLLAGLPADGKALLVTHQVNITALTGIFPRSGEIVVVSLDGSGTVVVEGRIRAD